MFFRAGGLGFFLCFVVAKSCLYLQNMLNQWVNTQGQLTEQHRICCFMVPKDSSEGDHLHKNMS